MGTKRFVETIASRENLIRVLDNLNEGIIAHDHRRRIYIFNAEAERVTGFHRDEVLGRDCHDVFDGAFCGRKCSFGDDRSPSTNPGHAEYPLNITTKGGEQRRVAFRSTTVRDERGDCAGIVASFRDMTELFDLRRRSGEITHFSNIIGGDANMRSVYQQIADVAQYDFPVHLFGETGTGKELVANAIHNESRRGGAPFVPINCGALPDGLIESELFGHVKGAFSGAIRDKKGRFELADGGTIFLDEVAELSKPLQVKLLRFLQEGTFEKVGGERTIEVNVRVISATNKDLKREVQRNNFREDLFYRLNVIPIQIPPLRERRNDIPLLVDHFLEQVGLRSGREMPEMGEPALSIMMEYTWPGNVRELQNAVQFAIVKSNNHTIEPEDLPMELRRMQRAVSQRGPAKKLGVRSVKEALVKTGGNKARAARELGVGRATLYRFLSENPNVAKNI
jgi:PAS domain S-box-containing protein